jgi:hypothetical protein
MKTLFGYLAAVTMAAAALPASAQTVQENDLIMTTENNPNNKISASYAFNASSFQISSGQPSGQPPVLSSFTPSNSQLNITVYAGRHKTSAVADTFNNNTTARVATRRSESSGGPDELNFTFSGTLTLNSDQFQNFFIGQGSTGDYNNWWVGVKTGTTATKESDVPGLYDVFLCIKGSTGTLYQIELPGNDSFHLNVMTLSAGMACGTYGP